MTVLLFSARLLPAEGGGPPLLPILPFLLKYEGDPAFFLSSVIDVAGTSRDRLRRLSCPIFDALFNA